MTTKTKGWIRYGIIIAVIALIIGGCKKKDQPKPPTEPTTPPTPPTENPVSVKEPEENDIPEKVDNTEVIEKIRAASANINQDITKIANAAKDWQPTLAGYNGKDAPNVNIKDIEGNSLSISSLKGKKTVIVTWSTMIKESKQMITTLAELHKQLGPEKLAVVAISREDPAILKPIVEEMGITFTVAGRGNRLVSPYRERIGPPAYFFIDEEGKIQLIAGKVIPPDDLNAIIEAL